MSIEHSPTPDDETRLNPDEDSIAERLNRDMDDERVKLRDAIANLSKIATLTVADTYATEEMEVMFAPGYQEQIADERNRLNQRLGELANQWEQLNSTINEVQRGVGSLQYMIDPENN